MKSPVLSVIREVNFKETELGPLPEDWQVVRLGDIARMKQGKVLPTSKLTISGFPVFGANGLIGFYHNYTHEETEVLVTCRGSTCGTVNISPPQSFITNNAMIITPFSGSKLTKQYLAFTLMKSDLSSTITGTGQPQITKGKLGLIPIPLPPLPEQNAIAYVLRTVQQAKEATEKVIAALKNLKKSLMLHLFTYGPVPLDKIDSVPLRETELGPLPEHWKMVRLGEVARVSSGGSAPQGIHYFGGKNPFVRVQHLDEDGYFLQRWDLITDEAVKNHRLKLFPANTIIFPKSGVSIRLEKRAILPIAAYLVSHLCAVVSNEKQLIHTFLFYALKNRRLASDKADNYPTLSLREIRELLLSLPPLPEQQEIARILQAVDRRIEAEEAYKKSLNELFKTFLHYLMSGKIRVKLLSSEDDSNKIDQDANN